MKSHLNLSPELFYHDSGNDSVLLDDLLNARNVYKIS